MKADPLATTAPATRYAQRSAPYSRGLSPPGGASAACSFCGLPIAGAGDQQQPRYCCYGCRFAASITAASGDEGQARLAMTKLGLAIFCAMNVMVFTMLLWSQPEVARTRVPLQTVWYDLARYACLLFTLPVVFLLAGPLVEDAAAELRRGRPSMSLLLLIGVAAALAYSLWSLLAGNGHVYFEVASMILVAVTLGRWLEATGKLQTTAALRGLKQLLPECARLLRGGAEWLVLIADLAAGDIFRVLPGERIVADGEVIRYEAAVDEQAVTGESMPVLRRKGDRVISGSLVVDGPLEIRAIAGVKEGTLSRMIEAVASATAGRTQYERLAEQISRWFLPVVTLIAALTTAVHVWLADPAGALLSALAVLVIACPCALGLATPMALWAAVGRAATAGVLIRDGNALAALAGARTICFDKTGTLTTGHATVAQVFIREEFDATLALPIARALSHASNHPLAAAISRYTQGLPGPGLSIENARVAAVRGICGWSPEAGATAFLGSRVWMHQCQNTMPAGSAFAGDAADDAAETFLAWGSHVRARFVFDEALRPEAETTIALLRRLGMNCVMLTGDRPARAKTLAQALGLHCRASLLPEEKLAAIRALQPTGPTVMVGDGINDAPALALADVGIALGCGTDISRHSAEVCLLTSDLSRLPWLIELSRRTQQTIRWNLVWAFGYNIIGIGLAAAGWLHPVFATIAMTASSLLVVTNSLALARHDAKPLATAEIAA